MNLLSLTLIIMFACLLTIFSTSMVFISYFKFKNLRVLEFRYIVYLCLSDFGFSFIVLISCICSLAEITYVPWVCQIQAACKVYVCSLEFFWTAVICYTLKKTVYQEQHDKEEYHNFWLKYGNTFAVILACIPFINHTYGPMEPLKDTNCFVDPAKVKHQYVFDWTTYGIFYLPLWLAFALNLKIIFQVFFKLRSSDFSDDIKKSAFTLFWYPSVFFFCWVWISVDRILGTFDIFESTTFAYIDYAITCLNGFFNSLLYAFTTISKQKIINVNSFSCSSKDQASDFPEINDMNLNISLQDKN